MRFSSQKPQGKHSLFKRGYASVDEKVDKGGRFVMSCYNCKYYYQAKGDEEEVCQNTEVLEWDMTITPTNIYCTRWCRT